LNRLSTPLFGDWGGAEMGAADGGGQGVGRVIGLGNFFEAQERFHHLLDLFFFRPAVAGDRLFDLQGGVGKNRQVVQARAS